MNSSLERLRTFCISFQVNLNLESVIPYTENEAKVLRNFIRFKGLCRIFSVMKPLGEEQTQG